jgi:hypothetical protein
MLINKKLDLFVVEMVQFFMSRKEAHSFMS